MISCFDILAMKIFMIVLKRKMRTPIMCSMEECAICMEDIHNEYIPFLQCNHYFHNKCLNEWTDIQSTCPTCRSDLNEINLLLVIPTASDNDWDKNYDKINVLMKKILRRRDSNGAFFFNMGVVYYDIQTLKTPLFDSNERLFIVYQNKAYIMNHSNPDNFNKT